MIVEQDTDYDSYTLYMDNIYDLVERYKKNPKEEFLKQYSIAVNHLLNDSDTNMSMVFQKEDTNGND